MGRTSTDGIGALYSFCLQAEMLQGVLRNFCQPLLYPLYCGTWYYRQEKDALQWSKDRLGELLGGLQIVNGEGGLWCAHQGHHDFIVRTFLSNVECEIAHSAKSSRNLFFGAVHRRPSRPPRQGEDNYCHLLHWRSIRQPQEGQDHRGAVH